MINVYGDSFAYGSDLKTNEKNVAECLSEELNIEVVNRAIPGNSNVVICHQLIEDIILSNLVSGDSAFVCFTETTRFTAWDEELASGQSTEISKYTPIFPSDNSPKRHHDLYKWSCTEEQGIYDLAHSIITMYNACEYHNIQVVFGYAFGTTINECKDKIIGTKMSDMIRYIERNDIIIANKKFSDFDENYRYGSHPSADAHKKYGEYISSYFEGLVI